MNITAAPSHPQPKATRLLPYLDEALKAGNLPDPEQLDRLEEGSPFRGLGFGHSLNDRLCYVQDRGLVRWATSPDELSANKRNFLLAAVPKAAIFTAVGALLNNGAGPIGMALGGSLGALIALDGEWRKYQGKVQVAVDGELQEARRFFMDPKEFELKPAELQMRLTAEGILGDRIGPAEVPALQADLAPWKSSMASFKQLGKERRLVADLGAQSDYGKPALHMVQPLQAAELLAAGRQVFVVSGEARDRTRTLEITAQNKERSRSHHEKHQFVERSYAYDLKPIQNPGDLLELPEGKGVPEGMFGVYRDEDSTTAIVSKKDQKQHLVLEKNHESNHFNYATSYIDPAANLGPANAEIGIRRYMNMTPLITLMGACVGGFGAMALGGQQYTLVGMVGAGLVGREIGRRVTDRLAV
jgi:hypothetical protein